MNQITVSYAIDKQEYSSTKDINKYMFFKDLFVIYWIITTFAA